MSRKEMLLYAQALARQFDLEVSLETLERLPDSVVVRIRGMPFDEFAELISILISQEKEKCFC